MIVDSDTHSWSTVRQSYINESFIRSALWVCKAHPKLETMEVTSEESIDERLRLTRDAYTVGMRLNMLQVHFVSFICQGPNSLREAKINNYLESTEPDETVSSDSLPSHDALQANLPCHTTNLSLSSELLFTTFRDIVNGILCVNSWSGYFNYMRAPCPKSKVKMATMLKSAIAESARRKYHKPGMDFSRIHASGTSRILTKGQRYAAKDGLKRVLFQDNWTFDGAVKYFDASCLVYKEKKLVETIDYSKRVGKRRSVVHSGDVIHEGSGSHTIELDLTTLDGDLCLFVLSAWMEATLLDIKTATVSFSDAQNASAPLLCTYDLDAHDKVSHLKSIVFCKLYRTKQGGWHVLAIGDSHRGSVDNYQPIYKAATKYL